MSRENSAYEATTKMLPYKWSAPEVVERGQNSHASDVWSFAVCVSVKFHRKPPESEAL